MVFIVLGSICNYQFYSVLLWFLLLVDVRHPHTHNHHNLICYFSCFGIYEKKYMKKLFSKFKNLSTIKKMALIVFVLFVILFSLFWYWVTNTFYYYLIHTIGIPQLSSISGISVDTIDWIIYKFPLYFKVISILIFLPIILLIIFKKKRKKNNKPTMKNYKL